MEAEYNTQVLHRFIVLEGLDGSGTTTQARRLEERLRSSPGVQPYLTCEPTGSFIGETVRKVLRREEEVAEGTLARLFSVDRYNHLYHGTEGIVELLSRGRTVITDRYLFSSLAYQSIDRPFEEVWELNRFFPLPEYLIFLDITPEEGSRRMDHRGTERELYEVTELQKDVRENYFHLFSLYQDSDMQIHLFDGTLGETELADTIWEKLGY